MNKKQFLGKVFFLFILIFTFSAYSQEAVKWDDETYISYFGDFNGDQVSDVLLLPLEETLAPKLVLGTEGGLKYSSVNQLILTSHINNQTVVAELVEIVVADYTNDGFSDLLIAFKEYNNAFLVAGSVNGLNFADPIKLYSNNELSVFDIGNFSFYAGNFNGDEYLDLLAISDNSKHHKVFHGKEGVNFELVQSKKNHFKWKNKAKTKVRIADINGDGKDDIIASSRKKGITHYVSFANKKGKLKKSKKLKAKLLNKEWNSDDFGLTVNDANGDGTLDIVKS
ncbi:FG-GAP repeat domain-containing protein [Thalassotalea piscium]|uniref:VCBS repeat-containing protein n=1 Tax=Thalassotalea piscium TaxID=1230533 RepID=A0A7X0NK92_9GAMM|nr:VCBS repeat-containing protein [Thalassotalea piscium]MBB6544989.1 hypothetical protein [Thalassotalea piscium]